jgi:hypothetical protein
MNNIQRGHVTCYTDDIKFRGILVGHSTLIFNCHYQKGEGNLSKLVNLRAARKPINDASNQQFKGTRLVVERMVPDQEDVG